MITSWYIYEWSSLNFKLKQVTARACEEAQAYITLMIKINYSGLIVQNEIQKFERNIYSSGYNILKLIIRSLQVHFYNNFIIHKKIIKLITYIDINSDIESRIKIIWLRHRTNVLLIHVFKKIWRLLRQSSSWFYHF